MARASLTQTRGLYSTGLGHGDALHCSDLDPDRKGSRFSTFRSGWRRGCQLPRRAHGENNLEETHGRQRA